MTNLEDLQKLIKLVPTQDKDQRYREALFDIIYTILDDYETRIAGLSAKKVYLGQAAVTGTLDVDLTAEFSAIDRVVASLASDPAATAMWVSAAKGGVAGHIDLKVWKPTAADGSEADVTPIAATTEANVNYAVIGDPA
jgi:hypothetical protein